jgi:hypothetical protein
MYAEGNNHKDLSIFIKILNSLKFLNIVLFIELYNISSTDKNIKPIYKTARKESQLLAGHPGYRFNDKNCSNGSLMTEKTNVITNKK